MFNQAAYSCTHAFFWRHFHIVKPQSLQLKRSANMLNQVDYSCTHYFVWSHRHILKPQSLQVRSSANMFNQAAYSCTHSFLWSHLHIIKPQSLQVRSSANNYVESSCLFLHPSPYMESSSHCQATVSPGEELSWDVVLSCEFLHLEECFLHCFCIVLFTTAVKLNICSGVIMVKWIPQC